MYILVLLDSRYGARCEIPCASVTEAEQIGHVYELDDGAEWYWYKEV